jgi:hypothetical protein
VQLTSEGLPPAIFELLQSNALSNMKKNSLYIVLLLLIVGAARLRGAEIQEP